MRFKSRIRTYSLYALYLANMRLVYSLSWLISFKKLPHRQSLIKLTMKLLKLNFPKDFCAPSFYTLTYAEWVHVSITMSPHHLAEYRRLVTNDFLHFIQEKNRAIEKGITK